MKELKADHVGMTYEVPKGEDVQALHDVSFHLEPGRLLTLLGPSGCGKTTLLNILAGFLAPTAGQATLGNAPITGPGRDRGMVFQQGALFEWLGVAENIAFGNDLAEGRGLKWYLLRIAEAVGWVLFLPIGVLLWQAFGWFAGVLGAAIVFGVSAFVLTQMKKARQARALAYAAPLLDEVGLQGFGDKQVYELSGGMQQRVALARCLANDPDVILMDEPLGALDALTREKMQSLILQLWKDTGKTIVLVTHSVEEALFLGDKLFVMAPRPGRIEREYDLPFARMGLEMEPRALKASAEFIEKREEILSLIWEMEEEIMGREGAER